MDWTQEEHTPPEDTNVEVMDLTDTLKIDKDRISFNDQCPVPEPVSVTVAGQTSTDELDYQPMCDFFSRLKPFVVSILGGFGSILMIAGGRRG